jgi:hypothetical protein
VITTPLPTSAMSATIHGKPPPARNERSRAGEARLPVGDVVTPNG